MKQLGIKQGLIAGIAAALLAFGYVLAGTSNQATAALNPNCASSMLQQGASGDCVRTAQELMKAKGTFAANPTGYFGPITHRAVIDTQRIAGIADDGIIGPDTWGVLYGNSQPGGQPTPATTTPVSRQQPALPATCITNHRTICVVKGQGSEATLYAVRNGVVERSMPARTGDSRGTRYVTTPGEHKVFWKHKDHISSIYNSEMPDSLFFNGGQAIHYSADFAKCGYKRNCGVGGGSSGGCVNIGSKVDSEWLYDWAQNGTRVYVTDNQLSV